MISDAMTPIVCWFVERDYYVYMRPYMIEGKFVWRVTIEKIGRQIIYVVAEDEDLNEAVRDAYRQTRKKLGLPSKKRRRRERNK